MGETKRKRHFSFSFPLSERIDMHKPATARERIQKVVFPAQGSPKFFLIVIFLFAFALRLSVMFATSSYHVVENDGTDHFGFGWEMGRVARSVAEGGGFSSPLPSPTGPTAIVGPVYPLLLALIFKVFGVYTTGSAIAVRVVQSVFSSLTCLFLYLCGRDTVGEATGKLAALIWAVFPLNIFFTVTKVWETSLTALLAAALFWYMLPLRHSLSVSRWSATGALLAIAALINTSLVVLVVPFGLSALWRNRTRLLLPATAAALTCVAVISPWLVRNRLEFGKFILRSNFPLEFRVGNNEFSPGQKLEDMHPAKSPYLNQRWHDIGEVRFMGEERDLNSRFLAADPNLFAFATVNRMVNYWTGAWIMPTLDFPNSWPVIIGTSIVSLLGLLGIRRMFYSGNSVAFMYAGCLFIYPLLYYVTTSQPRFYHSITPLLILSGSFWLVNWKNRLAPYARGSGSGSSLM
jgi:4-amino-4-deoxy-L-arabinose transferase-like glycosyltransferase